MKKTKQRLSQPSMLFPRRQYPNTIPADIPSAVYSEFPSDGPQGVETQNSHIGSIVSIAPTLYTIKQFVRKHQAFNEGGLRYLVWLSKPRRTSKGLLPGNGLDIAIVRVGRKVLIDEGKFFVWLNAQNQKGASHG